MMRRSSARAAITLLGVGLAIIAPSPVLGAQDIERCTTDVEMVGRDWQHLEYGASKGGAAARSTHRIGPDHTGPHVEYMRNQLRLALRQCQDGKTGEARLRLDMIRSWLKLPEVAR